jgi:hypothetical protein
LRDAATSVREDRAPGEPPRLRELQRELVAALKNSANESPAALTAALADASDRIADAINSLLHVLKR